MFKKIFNFFLFKDLSKSPRSVNHGNVCIFFIKCVPILSPDFLQSNNEKFKRAKVESLTCFSHLFCSEAHSTVVCTLLLAQDFIKTKGENNEHWILQERLEFFDCLPQTRSLQTESEKRDLGEHISKNVILVPPIINVSACLCFRLYLVSVSCHDQSQSI